MAEPSAGDAVTKESVRIEQITAPGMIAFRGDLDDAEVRAALAAVALVPMPKRRQILMDGERGLGWMSPDEVLVLLPPEEVPSALDALDHRLAGQHALAVDMSGARAAFRISGARAREVLAKLSPVDLSPEVFRPGELRRTRAGQVAAAFWVDDTGAFTLICFRSVAQYVHDILTLSAHPDTEVGFFGA